MVFGHHIRLAEYLRHQTMVQTMAVLRKKAKEIWVLNDDS